MADDEQLLNSNDLPAEQSQDYEVGFGKPPREYQFKPGESGNRKGRPRGSHNAETIFDRVTRELITVTKKGKKIQMTSLEGVVHQVQNQALAGDPRARSEYLRYASLFVKGNSALPQESMDREVRKKILEDFQKRRDRLPAAQSMAEVPAQTEEKPINVFE